MPDLKGTKTERNLKEAFAGESQARNKYTYYASAARKEGYEQIAAIAGCLDTGFLCHAGRSISPGSRFGNGRERARIWPPGRKKR